MRSKFWDGHDDCYFRVHGVDMEVFSFPFLFICSLLLLSFALFFCFNRLLGLNAYAGERAICLVWSELPAELTRLELWHFEWYDGEGDGVSCLATYSQIVCAVLSDDWDRG